MKSEQIVKQRGPAALEPRDVDDRRDGDFGDLRMVAKRVQHPESARKIPHGQRSQEPAAELAQVRLLEIRRPGRERPHEPAIAEISEPGRDHRRVEHFRHRPVAHPRILAQG